MAAIGIRGLCGDWRNGRRICGLWREIFFISAEDLRSGRYQVSQKQTGK
jgi:hypothetical protein